MIRASALRYWLFLWAVFKPIADIGRVKPTKADAGLPCGAWILGASLPGSSPTMASAFHPSTLTTVLVLLTWLLWGHWPALGALAAGMVAGGFLSRWAWQKTQLEPTPEGLYYTPHTYLGIALFVLFLARIVYRVVEVVWLLPPAETGMHHFVASPLTMSIFGLMAGHTIGYALALFAWRQRVLAAKAARLARAAGHQHGING